MDFPQDGRAPEAPAQTFAHPQAQASARTLATATPVPTAPPVRDTAAGTPGDRASAAPRGTALPGWTRGRTRAVRATAANLAAAAAEGVTAAVYLALALAALPAALLLRAVAAVLPRGRRGVPRLALVYLTAFPAFEVTALAGSALLRLRHPTGSAREDERRAYARLLGRACGICFGPGMRAAGLTVEPPADVRLPEPGRPVVVASRHAGTLNSQLGLHLVTAGLGQHPHGITKRAVTAQPGVAVLFRKVPIATFRWNAEGRGRALRELHRIGAAMGPGDGFLLFPEGTNFSVRRRREGIARLRRRSRPDLAAAAHRMHDVLPPHVTGLSALLTAAPDAQLIVLGHTGLEELLPWRLDRAAGRHGGDGRVRQRVWAYPAAEVPREAAELEPWLYERWREMDDWVRECRTPERP